MRRRAARGAAPRLRALLFVLVLRARLAAAAAATAGRAIGLLLSGSVKLAGLGLVGRGLVCRLDWVVRVAAAAR